MTGDQIFSCERNHIDIKILVCDIPSWQGKLTHTNGHKTPFVACYEIYTVADFFAVSPLATIALNALRKGFDSNLGPIQLHHKGADKWLPEFLDALRRLYSHDPTAVDKSDDMSPIRAAFVRFAYTARFPLLEIPAFNRFLDEEAPAFALDLFRAMRQSHDFLAWAPERCMYCKIKPQYGMKNYFTHLTPEILKLTACCSSCARIGGLGPPDSDWSDKMEDAAEARERKAADAPLATVTGGMLTVRLPEPSHAP